MWHEKHIRMLLTVTLLVFSRAFVLQAKLFMIKEERKIEDIQDFKRR